MSTGEPAPWQDIAARLRPFVARRVSPAEIDDVMQDGFLRMQRGLPALRDEDRLTPWLFQIARNSVADHMRARLRHPLPDGDESEVAALEPDDDDREAMRLLATSFTVFVAALPSPYPKP